MASNIDPHVAAIIDRSTGDSDDDEDALIAALEEDDEDGQLQTMREQRLVQLHQEFARAKTMKESGGGKYLEIKEEKEVMDITTSSKLVLVHFYKSDFGRCALMDGHLESLAPKHFDTRFLKISVDNAPFLVTKLNVRVLPCIIAFVNGVGVDRIVGFEGLGSGDKFTTRDLESRLFQSGVLIREKMTESNRVNFAPSSSKKKEIWQDEDDDWE